MANFQPILDYIESFLRKERNVPGCDLKIMQNHETLLRYQSGVADYEGKKPISDRDLYFLYSCTKPVTCAAAMQLIERGVFDLETPVATFLPEVCDAFRLQNGQRVPLSNTMTVRHLFTMSAGFNYDRDTEPIHQTLAANPHAGTVELVKAFLRSPLQFEPGEKFQYSLCHDVLAAVIEIASGMRFSDYVRQNIFEPLGMNRSYFQLLPEIQPDIVAQYECYEPLKYRPIGLRNAFRLSDQYESGGASMISCVDDYSLFADAMANGGVGSTGAQILKPETIDLMRTEQLRSFAVDPAFTCAAGPGYGYGLGVRTLVDKSEGQRSSLGEFGWDGAAGAYVMIDPACKLSIFFAMHVTGWPNLIGCGHAPIRDLTYEVLGL